jgi:hypothetical protein
LYHVKTRLRTAQSLFYFDGRSGGHFSRCEANRRTEALARPYGASATLEAVGTRMRRSKCGKKGVEVVVISIPRIRG